MKNKELAGDYFFRAGNRLAAIEILLERKSFADVVRESQEVVELLLKALLQRSGIEVPRLHDVSEILKAESAKLPKPVGPHVERLGAISRALRRDRELSFYGAEDLTPSEFYQEEDAQKAFKDAQWVHATLKPVF